MIVGILCLFGFRLPATNRFFFIAAGFADFWRRMAAEHPEAIARNGAASHPASAERFVGLERTVDEIERKRASGRALLPERQTRR